MIINEPGNYVLKYTATDECGNSTTKERNVTVTPPQTYRTVIYSDGTFIINEGSNDIEANVREHGVAEHIYDPLDEEHPYIFVEATTAPWYPVRHSVKSIEIGSYIEPVSTFAWFFDMLDATSVDIGNMDTSNVTDMSYMFSACRGLTSLDLSTFDTSNVTNMENMFSECSHLTLLDLSSFNTSNVTNMKSMFGFCRDLTPLDLSNFNTSNVTDMYGMFAGCSRLSSLDLSNFNTSNVTDMGHMFENCDSLSSLDLSTFDTSNVTDISNMFERCGSLSSLDLSTFDTSNVTNVTEMFRLCNGLETIYVSELFVIPQSAISVRMFAEMSSKLLGGAGTTWSSSNPTDKTYAHIDGGTSNPGYFTRKSA